MFARLAQGAVFDGVQKRSKAMANAKHEDGNRSERNASEHVKKQARDGGGNPVPSETDADVRRMVTNVNEKNAKMDTTSGIDAEGRHGEIDGSHRSQKTRRKNAPSMEMEGNRKGGGEATDQKAKLPTHGTKQTEGEEAGSSDVRTICTPEVRIARMRTRWPLLPYCADCTDCADCAGPRQMATRLRKQYKIHVSGAPQFPAPLESFESLLKLGAPTWLHKNIQALGFEEPTPIQRQAITVMLAGHELFAVAPTGSGKTLSFLVPVLTALKAHSPDGIRAVIVCPTKELGQQTHRVLKSLIGGRRIRSCILTKGSSSCAAYVAADVLVATPLRLSHLIKEGQVNLSSVTHLILDEADKLFELGFLGQLDSIIAACSNESCLRAMYSATLPEKVEDLAKTVMVDPVRVTIGERNSVASTIQQTVRYVGNEKGKLLAMRQILKEEGMRPPIIVFVQSKERAKQLFKELLYDDVRVGIIHADRSQAKRNEVVEDFRAGKTWVLIATDVLARGMDFKGVNCIVNYDFPQTSSAYIHRIGRSGRAGRPGFAVTLFTDTDASALRSIVNIMRVSGCEVPSWMLELKKTRSKDWKVAPRREPVGMES